MARFRGAVGYGQDQDNGNGVHDLVITELVYSGDVVRNSRQVESGDKVLNDLSAQNTISIVADEYANGHFFAIQYVVWAGACWTVINVEVQHPRLLLRLGGVYNGPKGALASGA